MSIDANTVRKIAKLSRIALSDDETTHMAGELSSIFSWIEQLQQVNTDGIPEMAGVGNYTLRPREDVVNDGNIKDDVLANAPESAFDCYVVPKVVE